MKLFYRIDRKMRFRTKLGLFVCELWKALWSPLILFGWHINDFEIKLLSAHTKYVCYEMKKRGIKTTNGTEPFPHGH